MPKALVVYVRTIGLVNQWIWKRLVWIVLFNVGLLLYETFTRYVLHNVCIWSTELLEHMIVGGVALGAGYILLHEEHVRMDIFYSRWSPRRRAIVDIATFCLFIYIFVIVWTFIPSALKAFRLGQRSATPWGPVFWPIKTVISVGAILLVLQGIAKLIGDIATVRGKPLQ